MAAIEYEFYTWLLAQLRANKSTLGVEAVHEQRTVQSNARGTIRLLYNSHAPEDLASGSDGNLETEIALRLEYRIKDDAAPERDLVKNVAAIRNFLRTTVLGCTISGILPLSFLITGTAEVDPREEFEYGADFQMIVKMRYSIRSGTA